MYNVQVPKSEKSARTYIVRSNSRLLFPCANIKKHLSCVFCRLEAVAESDTDTELGDNVIQLLTECDAEVEMWLQRKWLPHQKVMYSTLMQQLYQLMCV